MLLMRLALPITDHQVSQDILDFVADLNLSTVTDKFCHCSSLSYVIQEVLTNCLSVFRGYLSHTSDLVSTKTEQLLLHYQLLGCLHRLCLLQLAHHINGHHMPRRGTCSVS